MENGEGNEKVTVNTKELRNKFLREASEQDQKKITRVNPLDEIQALSKKEGVTVYENSPKARSDDIFGSENSSQVAITTNAKELRERFSNPQESHHISRSPIEIKGEYGGVYENEPITLEGVVRHGSNGDAEGQPKGQWATEAKQKFMEASSAQKEKQKVQLEIGEGGVYENTPVRLDNVVRHEESTIQLPTDTVKSGVERILKLQVEKSQPTPSNAVVLSDPNNTDAGVYENQPSASQADATATNGHSAVSTSLVSGKYASEAKQRFLQQQLEREEAQKQKATPGIINIWDDLCEYSGVFESAPSNTNGQTENLVALVAEAVDTTVAESAPEVIPK